MALLLVLLSLALTGCGAPGPKKVLESAIQWVKDDDCQAIGNGATSQSWWLYMKGGRTMTGLAGNLVIDGDTFYIRADASQSSGEASVAPMWVRFSRQDVGDEETVEKAKDILVGLVAASVSQPLLAMQTMTPDSQVAETSDGKAWVVTGKVTTLAQLELLFGKDAAKRYIEAGYEPDLERTVTVVVDKKTKRPLETTIATASVDPVFGKVSYSWLRGLWLPPDEDTVDLNKFLE